MAEVDPLEGDIVKVAEFLLVLNEAEQLNLADLVRGFVALGTSSERIRDALMIATSVLASLPDE